MVRVASGGQRAGALWNPAWVMSMGFGAKGSEMALWTRGASSLRGRGRRNECGATPSRAKATPPRCASLGEN